MYIPRREDSLRQACMEQGTRGIITMHRSARAAARALAVQQGAQCTALRAPSAPCLPVAASAVQRCGLHMAQVRLCSTAAAAGQAPAQAAPAGTEGQAEEEPKKRLSALEREIEERAKAKKLADRRMQLVESHTQSKGSFEDVTEFLDGGKAQLEALKQAIKDAEEKQTSILEWAGIIGGWFVKKAKNTKEWVSLTSEERQERRKTIKEERAQNRSVSDENMASFYQSQELINLMKFKGVTFDSGKEPGIPPSDFESFSRRVCDNYDLFKRTEAYSNMEFHVVRDPTKRESNFEKDERTNYKQIDDGALTNWLTEEGSAEASAPEEEDAPADGVVRPPPYRVDYETGEVVILDTCSPDEFLDFLEREAPRAEMRQLKLHNELTKLFEDMQRVTEAVGLKSIVFNGGQCSVTDREFKELKKGGREAEYVLPSDIAKVLKELESKQRLYSKYLNGVNLRILPGTPSRAYFIDAEEKEVCLPKDFYVDTFLPIHTKWSRLQKVENFIRSLKYIGCVIVITLLGDMEWPAPWPLAAA